MKKAIKWTLIIVGGLIVLFLAAAFILPVVFKDEIKAAIDKEIAKSVNADVVFDVDKFNLTLFKNFPNLTAEMNDFGVINRAPFEGEVLFATEKFQVDVNLKDILFGDQLRIKGISLIRPIINIKVTKDGKANYDIAISTPDTTTTSSEAENFSFGIDHWEIVDGEIVYDDQSMPFLLTLKGMNHKGSGDFTQAQFDLTTSTVVDSVTTSYGGTEYLADKRVMLDATISIAEEYTRYAFKENQLRVNDFAMHFDGWLKMNEDNFDMDIKFDTPDNSFKSLLSIVPGMYTESFNSIETKGELAFNGAVKGVYSEKQMPAFNVNLLVKDAMFKYPDLPSPVNNIQVDLAVDNRDGVIENTIINLKKMHAELGSNPIDARALISKMYPTQVDANIQAKMNLADLNKMFPMEGLTMKGNYALNLKANGVYDSLKKQIPAIDATMRLDNGYVKSADFPLPMDDLHFSSSIKNSSGKMAETVVRVNDFTMLMDNEKFTANLLLQNLDNYTWDLAAKGTIDLEKITKVFPVEGMTLAGKIKADIVTKGQYSDVLAERYDKLPTSGTASLSNFEYQSSGMPNVTVSQAEMIFDPKKIELRNVSGTAGRSDFKVAGSVMNYLGYLFGENETIKGAMNFSSRLLDLNEFMSDTEETTVDTTSTDYGVIPVPKNIDFVLNSSISTANLMNFTISNAAGDIIVRDGVANLNGLRFNMLGGTFVVNGIYNTKDEKQPTYDFGLKVESVSIKEAANASSLVQGFAPIAGLVNGNFSTDFRISGALLQNMMPDLKTVDGQGIIKIAQASLTQSKIVAGLTSLTKLENTDKVTLKDVLMSAQISNGRLSVKPFDVKFGDYKTTISGSTGLDGSLDYALKMDVPAGKLGTQFNSFLAQYGSGKQGNNEQIPVTIGLGGTYNSPQPKLLMQEQQEQVKEALATAAKEEGSKAVQEAIKGTEAEKIVSQIFNKPDSTKKDSVKTQNSAKQIEDAKNAIKGLLKKKKN